MEHLRQTSCSVRCNKLKLFSSSTTLCVCSFSVLFQIQLLACGRKKTSYQQVSELNSDFRRVGHLANHNYVAAPSSLQEKIVFDGYYFQSPFLFARLGRFFSLNARLLLLAVCSRVSNWMKHAMRLKKSIGKLRKSSTGLAAVPQQQ